MSTLGGVECLTAGQLSDLGGIGFSLEGEQLTSKALDIDSALRLGGVGGYILRSVFEMILFSSYGRI